MTPRERAIRQRLKDEFPHYASKCLWIRTKSGAVAPFVFNTAQQYLHAQLEQQRRETGQVRALVLKGRQQGCSTYVEGRFFHQVTHHPGMRAFILAHDQDASDSIFEMAERYYEHCPALVRPHLGASNAKELSFDRLDSGYQVATAGSKGAGRSKTIQFFHGSEVAYWPNADKHLAGALQTVPSGLGEVVLESTSDGPLGVFYELCQRALEGRGEYRLVFIPWFWQTEYRAPAPEGFTLDRDEETYRATYGLDLQQMAWRRAKIEEFNGQVGVFRTEYPATVEEAFKADVKGALWNRAQLTACRTHEHPPLARIVVAVDPQAVKDADNAETGIIAAGIDRQEQVYVLSDASLDGKPDEWGLEAAALYHKLRADVIIGESNNGGDMVKFTIQANDRRLPVELVWASRGKETRAGPVAALYRKGLVKHVGMLAGLEDQMCSWVPGRSTWSPNRIDALVWAITHLCDLQDAQDKGKGVATAPVNLFGGR